MCMYINVYLSTYRSIYPYIYSIVTNETPRTINYIQCSSDTTTTNVHCNSAFFTQIAAAPCHQFGLAGKDITGATATINTATTNKLLVLRNQ